MTEEEPEREYQLSEEGWLRRRKGIASLHSKNNEPYGIISSKVRFILFG